MRTQKEIWKALLEGKKLISRSGTIVQMTEDGFVRPDYSPKSVYVMETPSEWEIYEDPILYYKWKAEMIDRLSGKPYVKVSSVWYAEGTKPEIPGEWVRITPGKKFEDIGV